MSNLPVFILISFWLDQELSQKLLSYQKVLTELFSDNDQDSCSFLNWSLYNLLADISRDCMLSGHTTSNNNWVHVCVGDDNLLWLACLAVIIRCYWCKAHVLILEMLIFEKTEHLGIDKIQYHDLRLRTYLCNWVIAASFSIHWAEVSYSALYVQKLA